MSEDILSFGLRLTSKTLKAEDSGAHAQGAERAIFGLQTDHPAIGTQSDRVRSWYNGFIKTWKQHI